MKHFDPFPLGHFKIDWLKFGSQIKDMREGNGMSLREAAKLLDISPATIMRAEHGYSVDPDHFFTLLQFIGVQPVLPDAILQQD